MIHVNAVLTLSEIQEKGFRIMRGLYGASDYGAFSAHTPFFFALPGENGDEE
jgi:hypothetical protein